MVKKSKTYKNSICKKTDYEITFHGHFENKDNRIIITFGQANTGLAEEGFGTSFCRNKGIDHVHVAQRENTYYQGLSIEEFNKYVAPLTKGRDVITYGASLGAWCAFYYGGVVDAKVIGFSPLNPGHPDFTDNFISPKLPYNHKNLLDCPLSSKRPIVALDPFSGKDLKFLSTFILPSYPDALVYEAPFAGHNVLDRMRASGTLNDFVSSLLDGETPDKLRILTEGCSHWHQERAKMFQRKSDYHNAERELRLALAAERNKNTVTHLVNFFLKFKSPESLRVELCELGIYDDQSELLPIVAKNLAEAGFLGNR